MNWRSSTTPAKTSPSLELEQDIDAQRREWRFERAGWLLIVVLVVAALTGAFGDGPLARHVARSPVNGATVEYDRVVRSGTASTLTLMLGASDATDTIADFAFDRRYLASMGVDRITPAPIESRASNEWVVYRIRRATAGQPAQVDIVVSPQGIGRRRLVIETFGFGTIELRQFILP